MSAPENRETQATPSNLSEAMLRADFQASDLSQLATLKAIRQCYEEEGFFIVRGLAKPYVAPVLSDVEYFVEQSYLQLADAVDTPIGKKTPNDTVFMPAPKHFDREHQIMVLAMSYRNSAAFFHSALDKRTLDIAETILGPDVELFLDGQSIYKEPSGGLEKNLHQDSAYFEHYLDGPLAALHYLIPTVVENGALHVIPGSHKLGALKHQDSSSHLGLDPKQYSWEQATPVEGDAGDVIFFHVDTIHGSKPNFSNAPRPNYIHRYRRANDFITVHAITATQREEAEHAETARRNEKPKDQWGLMVRGRRS